MKNDKVNIMINGDETSKNEIVYNNVIDNMKLTEKEQLTYLRNKVISLEMEMRNKKLTLLLALISIIGITFGCYLLIMDFYILGITFIVGTFSGVMIRSYLMFKNIINITKSNKFDRIENLRKLLDKKIK
ncbi:MAG: hypothetical protein PHN42_04155 [Bacilli bacterium]|nr:hypothetical protein [Bacilli bacterium]